MNKKRVAKEWLLFLGCFLFGLLVLPAPLAVLLHRDQALLFLPLFYSELLEKHYALINWLVVASPYLLCQIVRSVIWAWKAARTP
jgi:hypothetical protein